MSDDSRLLDGVAEAAILPQWGEVYPRPILDRAALYGLAGEIVTAIAPHTEAAPVAMLLTLLAAFGNAAGAESRALVGDDEHPARLYVALVGPTASGAKGTSLSAVRPILRTADDGWFSTARISGFASGEAIIARLSGRLHPDAEATADRRAFVVEPEFSRLLLVNSRDGSTASPILRGAWDEGRLQLIRAKQELLASGVHLSLLGHITPDELRARMSGTEISGGFANRVLFPYVERAQRIPNPTVLNPWLIAAFASRLRAAMDFARERRELRRTPEAETIWAEFYENEPERHGIVGEITARSAAQRLRLSVTYALLDASQVVRPEHVLAAEATWRYCAASVEHLFGDLRGDKVQDRLLQALRDASQGGLDGRQQHEAFGRHVSAERLNLARETLERHGLVRTEYETTGGRERLVSFAIPLRTSEQTRTKHADELFVRLNSLVRVPEEASRAPGQRQPEAMSKGRASTDSAWPFPRDLGKWPIARQYRA